MKTTSIFLLLTLALLLTACGFQLRGSDSLGLPDEAIYLNTSGAGETGRNIREQLELGQANLTDSGRGAAYSVRVSNERFRREVLSVSPRTGKVQEYELILDAFLSVRSAEGQSLLDNERLSVSRDYFFDESAVIASGDEEQLIREELTRQISRQALLRMGAVIRNHQQGEAPATQTE